MSTTLTIRIKTYCYAFVPVEKKIFIKLKI